MPGVAFLRFALTAKAVAVLFVVNILMSHITIRTIKKGHEISPIPSNVLYLFLLTAASIKISIKDGISSTT